MNSAASEIIGQMFIDDNNWINTSTADMTAMIADCDAFVSFHGLKFNKKKCEYMVVNQLDCRREDNSYNEWELPRGPRGKASSQRPDKWRTCTGGNSSMTTYVSKLATLREGA